MKKLVLTLVALLVMAVQASAMSYEQARQQALFLTDKMAYELNLTDAQYEAAYEINLDYLMSINTYDDLYGVYWRQRNLDLSYVLLDWQYRTYVDAAYFYRPLYWNGGYWHFSIYARYPHRDYFFFGRPSIYVTYYGGHSWRMNGGRSWYYGRRFDGPRRGDRGDFGRGTRFDGRDFGDHGNGNRSFGNGTRFGGNGNRSFGGGNRTYSVSSAPSGYDPQRDRTRSFGARQSSTRTTVTQQSRSFGGNTTMGEPSRTFSAPNRSFGTRSSETNRSFGSSAPSRSFGSGSNAPSRSFGSGSSAPARSFGGGNNAPSRSFGGGGAFGGSHSSGGGHFGNGR